jgi:type IX secretion system substrate protein
MKSLILFITIIFTANILAQVKSSVVLKLSYIDAPFEVRIDNSGIYGISNFEIENNSISLFDFNQPVKHVFSDSKFIKTSEFSELSLLGKTIYNGETESVLFDDEGILKNKLGKSFSLNVADINTLSIVNDLSNRQAQFTITFPGDLAYADLIGIDSEGFTYLLVERFVQQVPLKIMRQVYTLNSLGEVQSILRIPDIKYLFTQNDFQIDEFGNLYHLLSIESGIEIFKWEGLKNKSEQVVNYPKEYNYQLHFNNLLPVDEIETVPVLNKITSVSRTMALRIGESYVYHKFNCSSANLAPTDVTAPDNDVVRTPARLRVGPNARVPYKWGGFNTLTQFDVGLVQGKYAGDINTNGVSSYAVGVDCSGFVSRCWQMSYHASTSYMPNITNLYSNWSNLKPGDAIHKVGHVRLYISTQPNGRIKVVESTTGHSIYGVGYYNYAPSDLSEYAPRYYTNMVDDYFENQPTLLSVTHGQNNDAIIKWDCNDSEVIGYRLYRSPDRVNWNLIQNESTLTEKFTTDNYQPGEYYYRVSSVKNNSPIFSESDLSNELGIGGSAGSDIFLIVDGFDREDGSWRGAGHKFAGRYGAAIFDIGVRFESIKSSELENANTNLTDYAGVFWIIGDESTADETFNSYEQSIIISYMESGGNLFVSGSEIGWDLDYQGSASDRNFYNNYLKADYVSDDAGTLFASGVTNSSLQNCSLYFGQTYDEEYPDEIIPHGGSSLCMQYSNQNGAGVEYTGTFGNSSEVGKIIYLAFPLETTADDTAFDLVINNALLYFDPSIVGVNDEQVLPLDYGLEQNYPNPFNPTTKIKYAVPRHGRQANVAEALNASTTNILLKVYDVLGNEITTLVNEQKSPGVYEVEWNAGNQPSGVYFYRVQTESFSKTMKMMLLK